ncbi:hypothetical protein BJ165DRAFT_1441207 [Panaeolus papilionaceus]|nr:hypothetical protein BJ165DRAFT_1441207 [Panaeolus papilionaceus]
MGSRQDHLLVTHHRTFVSPFLMACAARPILYIFYGTLSSRLPNTCDTMEFPTTASSTQPATKKPRELRIGIPSPFAGDTYKYNTFKQSVQLYLALNKEIYDTEFKKIAFVLNYLKGGTAAQDFITALDKVFLTQDEEDRFGQLDALKNVKQNGRRAAEFVVEFRVYAYLASSGPGSLGDDYVIDTLRRALDRWLLKDAVFSGEAPKTLDEWYTRVVHLDENYRRWNLIPGKDDDTDEWMSRSDLGEDTASQGGGSREVMLTCSQCGKVGHFARDCRNSKDANVVKPRNPNYKGKNYDPNYQHPLSRRSKTKGDKSPEVPRLTYLWHRTDLIARLVGAELGTTIVLFQCCLPRLISPHPPFTFHV